MKIVDLNYTPENNNHNNDKEELSVGALIILLSPFALGLYVLLTKSFLHGIF